MDFLSNASYSGYRNHIQKDTLQENVKFGQCDWTWHVDLLSGWRNKEPAWDLIGQDNHWEVPKRPRINTQDTLLTLALNFSSRSWMLRPLGPLSLSLRKMHSLENAIYWLSLQLWTTPSQLRPWWEEKPPSLFTSFYSFTFVYFLSVEFVC